MRRGPWALGVALVLFASVARGQVHLPVNATPWSYVAPPFVAHCLHDYRLYLPEAPLEQPATGWPVLVHFDLSGYWNTVDFPQLDAQAPGLAGYEKTQRRLAKALASGIAVVTCRATTSAPTLICDTGTETLPGHGLFHPPGFVPPDLVGAGSAGADIAPYDTLHYHMPEKDAVMIVQHLRHGAGLTTGPLSSLDPDRIAVEGGSTAASVLMWIAFGPDRSTTAPFAGLGGQHAVSSRPDAAILRSGITWQPLQSDVNPSGPPPKNNHFGRDGHSETPAATLGHALLSERVAFSALAYADALAPDSIYLTYDEPFPCQDFTPDTVGCAPELPFCFGCENTTFGVHAAWHGYAAKAMFPDAVRLVITTCEVFAQKDDLGDPGFAQVPAVPIFDDVHALQTDMIAFLGAAFGIAGAAPASPWTTIERSWMPLAEACIDIKESEFPELDGSGSLEVGELVSVRMFGMPTPGLAMLIVGFRDASTPIFGTVGVPSLDVVTPVFPVLASPLSLSATWPSEIPLGTTLYMQAFGSDGAGIVSTNALQAIVP